LASLQNVVNTVSMWLGFLTSAWKCAKCWEESFN